MLNVGRIELSLEALIEFPKQEKTQDRDEEGSPCGSEVKNLSAVQIQVQFLGWEDFLEEAWQPTPVFLRILENLMDRGAWWATVHRVTKSWTRLK